MQKLLPWIKRQSIQKQIQITIILISVISTLLLGVGSYLTYKSSFEKNYKENFRYNLEISDTIMNIHLENIVDLSRNLLANGALMDALGQSQEQDGKYFNSSQSQVFEQALRGIAGQDTFISEAALLDNSGKLYCYRSNVRTTNNYWRDGIVTEDWIKAAKEAKGKEVFYTYNILEGDKGTVTFSMVKRLIDIRTDSEMGYLVVNIRKKLLADSFVYLKDSYETNCFFAIGEEGDTAYFIGNEDYKEQVLKEYRSQNRWNSSFVFAEARNELLGWDLVSVINKSELANQSLIIGLAILMIILSVIVLGSIFSRSISRRIYKPLNQLTEMIQQVGAGGRRLEQEFDDSEVGQIGNQFKEMVENNLELRENLLVTQVKEREAELLLLQSQINPHFLYNTLDSIYCMAIINHQDDIAKMVTNLSTMFRLSLNKGNKMVPVLDETEHIRTYMEIQNIRFKNRFTFELDIPKECMGLYVLKFILQPFVENAVYHGLEPQVGPGRIQVKVRRKGDVLYFYVTDDGVGIEDLDAVYQGYGVKNVAERIELHYGKSYGIRFKSIKGKGTTVEIKVAVSEQEKELEDVQGSDC